MQLIVADLEQLGLVALAMLLGAVLGLDRELADKPAGLRTHMLVAGAAALFVPLGATLLNSFTENFDPQLVQADPVRVLEAIITGVSVLGAGTILHNRGEQEVEGLTTAASIVYTSGLGVVVALRQITLAIGATLLAVITLRLLGFAENWFKDRREANSSD